MNFTQERLRNEEDFIAILRLLAKNNEILNEHLANAWSKECKIHKLDHSK